MDIVDIAGRTRVFGAPQDWNPERDGECGALPIRDERFAPGTNKMVSEWKPSAIEIEHLKLGAPLQLGIIGTTHPVVSLGVGAVPPRPAEESAARMSRIEALLKALEEWPERLIEQDMDVTSRADLTVVLTRARLLILDLLGISAKPMGEQIADALATQAKVHAADIAGGSDEAAGSLPDMLTFARRWLPECFPANEEGQIPFARALCESLMDAAEVHMKREAERRQDEAWDRAEGAARRDALKDE